MIKTFSLRPLAAVATAATVSLTLLAQQPPATQPPATPQQPTEVTVPVIGSGPGVVPKLAVVGFIALSPDAETVTAAKTIGDVLYDDIAYEREYYMIAKDAVATVPKPTSIDQVPLERWKELNADGVLVGAVRKAASGVVVQVRLIKVATGESVFGKEYSGSVANPRRFAHTIWDELYKHQMQGRGVARTRLTFSSDRTADLIKGPAGNRDVQEIFIADYDGANPRKVTNTRTLNITPTWSPDNQVIAYTSYRPSGGMGTFQDIVLSSIETGERKTPADGNPSKQNYLPIWSADGTKIAFTTNRDGNPEIYVMNRDGTGLRRMTNSPGIDVAPTWAPSGNQIAWVSDRTGTPRCYIMNADSTGQRVLIGEECHRPTWSSEPFNEIAYAAKNGPGYDIKIYSFATGQSLRITDGIGSNESPAFAPNGRHLAFTSTRNGKVQVYTIARDGNDLRQITREGNNKYPNWSQPPAEPRR
jgi:TolB protein